MNIDSFFSEIMGKEQLSKTDFVALGLDSLFVDAARESSGQVLDSFIIRYYEE